MLLRQVPELKIVSGFFNLTSLKCTTAQSRHDHNCNDPTGGVAQQQQQLGSSALQLGCVLFLWLIRVRSPRNVSSGNVNSKLQTAGVRCPLLQLPVVLIQPRRCSGENQFLVISPSLDPCVGCEEWLIESRAQSPLLPWCNKARCLLTISLMFMLAGSRGRYC